MIPRTTPPLFSDRIPLDCLDHVSEAHGFGASAVVIYQCEGEDQPLECAHCDSLLTASENALVVFCDEAATLQRCFVASIGQHEPGVWDICFDLCQSGKGSSK